MNPTICPAILAKDSQDFRTQIERVRSFAPRLHIDFSDGMFTTGTTLPIAEAWWPANLQVDFHVMYQKPLSVLEAVKALRPRLVIVHAEAEGDFAALAAELHAHGIEAGVALLPETPVELIAPALGLLDHVLVFSGSLGHFGGQANLQLIDKVRQLRSLKPGLEIGWDGGVNADNAAQLAAGGVDVLDVGGFIQNAEHPANAYAKLKEVIS